MDASPQRSIHYVPPACLAPITVALLLPAAAAYAEPGGSTRRVTVTATVMMNCRLQPVEGGGAEVKCSNGALPRVEGCHGGCPADLKRRAFGLAESRIERRADGQRLVTILF
jgi:hypothetical protein